MFASDIYSLGATCINLLTGRSPFDSYDTNHGTWIWQQYLKTPVSSDLQRIINKMLESIPVRRYQTVDEVLKELNQKSPAQNPPAKTIQLTPQTTPPTSIAKSQNQIDLELEELKTQFLVGGKPKQQNIQPQATTNTSVNKSEIDRDLEELKAKYLGNNNP
jgi:serine/threonine protein kinase